MKKIFVLIGLLTLTKVYGASYEEFEKQFEAFKTAVNTVKEALKKSNLSTQDIEIIYQDIKKTIITGETLTHHINGVSKKVYRALKEEKGLGAEPKKSENEIKKIEGEIYNDKKYSPYNEMRASIYNILYQDHSGSLQYLFKEKLQELKTELKQRSEKLEEAQETAQRDFEKISTYYTDLCQIKDFDTGWNEDLLNIKDILHTQNYLKNLQSSVWHPSPKIHFFPDEEQFEKIHTTFKEEYEANAKFKEYNKMYMEYLNSLSQFNKDIKTAETKTAEIKKIIETLEKTREEEMKKLLGASRVKGDWVIAELPQ